jgi:hypothetical protein
LNLIEVNISLASKSIFKKGRVKLVILEEIIMNLHPQIEPASTGRLLTCLGLAIDEAKRVRSIIKSKDSAAELELEKPAPRKLILLNREIELLEAKLDKIRSQASRV